MTSQQPQINIYQNEEQEKKSPVKIVILIIAIIWIILGVTGFIMSIICFGRSGTTAQHIIGLLLAIFFGPIYWIFYFVVPDYCKRLFT
jgi:cytochrome b subunit of formate dehydrogenase